jgi:hypothetical protein
MPIYTIQQGDHLSARANQFGFFELKSMWDHQCDNGLNVDGVCDSATRSKHMQVHGC